MKKLFKILLSLILLLIVVLAVAIACVLYFADPNKLKPAITKEVQKKTNYQLVIDGDLSWSFYPTLGVKMHKVSLAAPRQPKPFLVLDELTVAMDPLQFIQGYNQVQGDLNIGMVTLSGMKTTKVKAKLKWADKKLTIKPLRASLYGGSVNADAVGDSLTEVPNWRVNAKFNDVDMQRFLKDINPDSNINFGGNADVTVNVTTKGKEKQAVLTNLNGQASFKIDNGILNGVDVNYYVNAADALLQQEPVPPRQGVSRTAFDHVTGSAEISSGVAYTDNFIMSSSSFVTKAKGRIYLATKRLDMRLSIEPIKTKSDWLIPVLVEGDMKSPDVRLDMGVLHKELAKQQLGKVRDRVNDEVDKLAPKAGDFVNKLLGN